MDALKSYLTVIPLLLLISSCVDYSTVTALSTPVNKIAIQDYYSPCCGSCGERIVIEESKGKQYTLQVPCNIEDKYSRMCTPYSIGTQKQILLYKKNKVFEQKFFKAVYDTIELKKLFPHVDKGEYYDSASASKPVIPLGRMDTLLIEKYLALTKKPGCNASYIKLIRGFAEVELRPDLHFDKKKIKFKTR